MRYLYKEQEIGGITMATLKELAERTGCSQAAISRILNADPT